MKFTRIFGLFSIAIILALLVMVIPATSAQAYDREIELFDEWGDEIDEAEIGEEITVRGEDFVPSRSGDDYYRYVDIYFSSDEADKLDDIDIEVEDYEQYRGREIDDDGEFIYSFDVPEELNDGEDDIDVETGETYWVYVTHGYTDPDFPSTRIEAIAELTIIGGGEITLDISQGPVDTEVEITGTSFARDKDIAIAYDGVVVPKEPGSDYETDDDGEFLSYILIPESTAGAHPINVTVSGSTVSADFTVEPEITITPTSGEAGDSVWVSGTGFGRRKSVVIYFNNQLWGTEMSGSEGSFSTSSPLIVPSGLAAGIYDIDAEDYVDSSIADGAGFTVIVPPPPPPPEPEPAAFSLSNLIVQPVEVQPDEAVNITVLLANTGGTEGSYPVVLKINGVGEAEESVTAAAGGSETVGFSVTREEAGNYAVAVDDLSASFTVVAPPPPTPEPPAPEVSLTQDSGRVGTSMAVSGSGFEAGGTVTVKYDGEEIATAPADDAYGIFAAYFYIPISEAGAHTITVTDGTSTEEFTFTVEPTPPLVPIPLLPQMGIEVEAPIYFDWNDVTTDIPPITYTLQIATSDEFSATSVALEKVGLAKSEYTITVEEELAGRETPYYWRVRAVDAVSNEGAWTGAGQFYVAVPSEGLLPPWALYTLIGLGGLLLFAIGYWLGRRTAYYY
ncbi:hypothetical protein ES703_62193 [subsurface metagenome]